MDAGRDSNRNRNFQIGPTSSFLEGHATGQCRTEEQRLDEKRPGQETGRADTNTAG
jgi:hypothetical protein